MDNVQHGMTLREAACRYGVPRTTLQRHVRANNTGRRLGRYRPVFSAAQEMCLVECIQRMNTAFHGLRIGEIKVLAYEFAQQNHIEHPFKHGMAGDGWATPFFRRHRELTSCISINNGRSDRFHRERLQRFYRSLQRVYTEHSIMPKDVYSCAQISVKLPSRGSHPVLPARPGRQTVTAIHCSNAEGHFIPPGLVFPRHTINTPQLLDRAPAHSLGMLSKCGGVTTQVVLSWMSFFVRQVEPSQEQPMLLIVEDIQPYRTLAVLDYATRNHISLLSAPSRTRRRPTQLGPNPLSHFLSATLPTSLDMESLRNQSSGGQIQITDIVRLLGNVSQNVSYIQDIVSRFSSCGVHPYHQDVF